MFENEKIADLTKLLLKEIGEDPNREGLIKTPSRVSKAWSFFSRGYNQDVDEIINDAIFNENAKDMVVVRDVEFFSLCEHHLIPFFGKAHVAYIPNGKVVGLSKIPRIIDMFSRIIPSLIGVTNGTISPKIKPFSLTFFKVKISS